MKNFYKIIFGLSLTLFIVCAFSIVKIYMPEDNNAEDYANTTNVSKEDSLPVNPVNFNKLQKINSDVYAYIKIPDTEIDYPIVQASNDKDDNFYIDHDINQNYKFEGMIYSQRKNSLAFDDPVTVLYGHNMLNGSMFAQLHNFESIDFFNKHSKFYIYTPGHILTYKIVSAYVYDDRHILNSFNFRKKKDFKSYVNSINNPKSMVANVRDDFKATVNDNIVTLSTCTANDSQRYLVQGVLVNDQLTQ